jgi:hypothetical protein
MKPNETFQVSNGPIYSPYGRDVRGFSVAGAEERKYYRQIAEKLLYLRMHKVIGREKKFERYLSEKYKEFRQIVNELAITKRYSDNPSDIVKRDIWN